MKIRTIIAATCAALAFSMAGAVFAHDGQAKTVTNKFEAAIPNIQGNVSKTEPAKPLAVFILDTNDKVLTTPIT